MAYQPQDQGGYPNPNQYNTNYPPPPSQGYTQPQLPPGYPPPPNQNYVPPGPAYAPPGAGYQQPGPGYQPQGPGYQPQGPGYQPQGPGYLPPGSGYGPGQPGAPITAQPMGQNDPQGGWMNMPQGYPNCPPGLQYLTMIDQLLVHQKVELLEALTGFETNNKFTIKNSLGQKIYFAIEENDCLTRNCCGPLRPFEMKILDNYRNQVINLNRALACDSCCFPCCLQTMEVSAPPGTVIGTIEQECSILQPEFVIKNGAGEIVLRIEGPICTMSICGDVEFKVLSADGNTQVGKISKQWSGLVREMFTDTDYFGITFPMDLDVRMKAVMLGACFLIDAMFFEKGGHNN